jgi:hypothetical protein
MGVRKYRAIEDMPGPPPRLPLDPENLRLAFGLMDLARRLSSLPYLPGVRKYGSHDEMVRAREQRAAAHLRRVRAGEGRG